MDASREPFALHELVERMKLAIDRLPIGCVITGHDFRVVYWNPAAERVFGFSRAEVLGKHPFDTIVPKEMHQHTAQIFARVAAGDMDVSGVVGTNVTRDGRQITCRWTNTPLFDSSGSFLGSMATVEDLTERARAEEELKESRSFLEQAQAVGQIGSWVSGLEPGGNLSWSGEVFRIFGVEEDEFKGSVDDFWARVHPDDLERVKAASAAAIQSDAAYDLDHRIVRPDGQVRWVHERARILRDAEHKPLRMLGVVQDITDRKRLEEELFQAQKLESIGRLAGGIAHDFNNLLTAIVGYGELARATLEDSHPVQADLREIDRAAQRATRLTQQLLAFARRQMIEPRLIDLSSLVLGLHQMLSRTLGEDVKLVTVLGPGLWPVRADPGQMEQVLLNLAVNARDAMPSGGRLMIETSNVMTDGGERVRLSVSDTGIGMTPEVLERIFEPFFTTKEPGKGTGLGLATCYGIVKQAGGTIWVESEPGRGAAFRIDMPRAAGTFSSEPEIAPSNAPRGHETLLLVEDEELVRSVAARSLKESGYQVIEAAGPVEALHASAEHAAPIALLVTDVVMPQMNGRELADRLVQSRPNMKVLYLSGYAESEVVRQGVVDPGITLLRKPFTPQDLARTVREVLDG